MANIKILVATHKECPLPQNDIFLPIQVGKKIATHKMNIQGDDEGDNISEKNPNYCELTAMYWAWKNLENIDYIGLVHYRRYFCTSNLYQHTRYLTVKEFEEKTDSIPIPDYQKMLKKHDIVKVKPFTYYHSIESVLSNILTAEDLRLLEKLIKEKYPEYYSTYIEYMRYNNKISSCNMFISNFDVYKAYCSWIFGLLFELEKRVSISAYSEPARIFGFLSEALFNIYCINNKLKIKYISIYTIRDDVRNDNHLIYTLKNIRRNLSFFFNKPKR